MSTKIKEIEVVVDYSKIDNEIDNVYREIEEKVKILESRIKQLRKKEEILDDFIFANQAKLESTDSKNYKLRAQLQTTISKQLEVQQLITDTIIKYEKIVQDYLIQKQKIQNDKLTNYIKWKKAFESKADENQFLEILEKFNNAIEQLDNQGALEIKNESKFQKEIVEEVLKQTFNEGYEI